MARVHGPVGLAGARLMLDSTCRVTGAFALVLSAVVALAREPDVVAVSLTNAEYRFQLVDNPSLKDHLTVSKVFRERKAECAINGGFFDENFNPVGYYKVDGEVRSSHPSRGLSGYVCIDSEGKLSIHFKKVDPEQYASVFQAGPMLVDPGGKPGIKSDDGKTADRTAIVQLKDGSFAFLYHAKTTLYALSHYILSKYPTVDRALNLDGGPEAGIATKVPSLEIRENTIASKAYVVVKRRKDDENTRQLHAEEASNVFP